MKKRLLEGDALMQRARELGVSTESDGMVNVPGQGSVPTTAAEYEIQRRVLEAERHIREHRLWIVAFVSATASVVSAIAAWAIAVSP